MAKEQLSTPRDKEKEKRQDIEFNKRREILDNYFNRNYDSIVPSRSKRYQEDSDLEN